MAHGHGLQRPRVSAGGRRSFRPPGSHRRPESPTAAIVIWRGIHDEHRCRNDHVLGASHGGAVPSALALQTLTLVIPRADHPTVPAHSPPDRRGPGWSIVALAVFAVSALHLSQREGAHGVVYVELAGHHASIPLIFAILYQDFRFALADVFLKRALALFALVAIASGLYVGIEVPLLARHDFRDDPVAVGGSVILWVGRRCSTRRYAVPRRGPSIASSSTAPITNSFATISTGALPLWGTTRGNGCSRRRIAHAAVGR